MRYKEVKKRRNIFVWILVLLCAGILAFVFIKDRAEAPAREQDEMHFKGPIGEPSVKGPTTPPPSTQ